MSKVSAGFQWLENETTGDPTGLRRASDGKEFNVPTYATDPLTGEVTGLVGPKGGVGLFSGYPALQSIPGIVAFWDFAEPRAPFCSKAGRGLFPLRQGTGSRAKKTSNGPLGNALLFNGSSDYLILDAASIGDLNIGGRGINQCFVLAFVARSNSSLSSFIGGCWREDNNNPIRQYGLFVDLGTYGGNDKVCFHVSKNGSASPNIPYSRDYSANGSAEPNREWACISGSYDGQYARSYIEGRFEPYANYTEPGAPNGEGLTYDKNPYAFSLGLNDKPCDFTVGACLLTAGYRNFFAGELAGLLVMDRAPTLAEIKDIQNAINPATYGFKNRLFQWNTNNTGVNALTGCASYKTSTAMDDSAGATSIAAFVRTAAGSPAQGFIYRPSTASGIPALLTCSSIPDNITTTSLSAVTFELACANIADSIRLCLKVGSDWYATDTQYTVAVASASGADWTNAETKTLAFAKTAALWRDVTLVPGATLSIAGAARSTDLPDGTITGWGFFSSVVPAGNLRFRNVELLTL